MKVPLLNVHYSAVFLLDATSELLAPCNLAAIKRLQKEICQDSSVATSSSQEMGFSPIIPKIETYISNSGIGREGKPIL